MQIETIKNKTLFYFDEGSDVKVDDDGWLTLLDLETTLGARLSPIDLADIIVKTAKVCGSNDVNEIINIIERKCNASEGEFREVIGIDNDDSNKELGLTSEGKKHVYNLIVNDKSVEHHTNSHTICYQDLVRIAYERFDPHRTYGVLFHYPKGVNKKSGNLVNNLAVDLHDGMIFNVSR